MTLPVDVYLLYAIYWKLKFLDSFYRSFIVMIVEVNKPFNC